VVAVTCEQVQQAPAQRPPADDRMAKFVSTVLADTEDVWKDVFTKGGASLPGAAAGAVSGCTTTACGTGQAAMGPVLLPG
jgi:predicted metalloprotease